MCQTEEMPSSLPSAPAPSAQAVVKQFVREHVKGRRIVVVTEEGRSADYVVTLDRKLTTLSVQNARSREDGAIQIPLEQVDEIAMGTDCQEDVGGELDDLCVTLFLEDGRNLSLSFRDQEERDTFGLCLSMFVDGRRNADGDGDGAAASSGNESDGSTERTESTHASSSPSDAKAVVKEFVRSFIKGHRVSVLTVHGGTSDCLATLDRKLTTLSVQRGDKKGSQQRHIPLKQVEEISVGTDATDDIELPLDDNCVTLMLEGGQGIAFQFEDCEKRDTFALCLSIFVDGQRGGGGKRR